MCHINGANIQHGKSQIFYQKNITESLNECEQVKEKLSCNTGVTLMGSVAHSSFTDISMKGIHSTSFILHWGGYSNFDSMKMLAPDILEHDDYELYETYHPNNIEISNIDIEKNTRFLIISSSYNIDVHDIQGEFSSLLLLLPGDEGDLHANSQQKNKIMSHINFSNISADIFTKVSDYIIRTSSYGTSKVDYEKRLFPISDMSIKDIQINNISRTNNLNYRYGINANQTYGNNIIFQNIDLGDIGKKMYYDTQNNKLVPSYGIYINEGKGVIFDNITSKAQYGFGLVDSENITLQNSNFSSLNLEEKNYGVYTGIKTDTNTNITLLNNNITNYDTGIYYFGSPECSQYSINQVQFTNVAKIEHGNTCIIE